MLEYQLFLMCEVFNLTEMSMHEFLKSHFSVVSLCITFSETKDLFVTLLLLLCE